ncbi:MAG: CD1871A family CXXC motif-containing protein [Hespellia sp.]|nr:CD1871A family CXXC motif-containing protein [Hespellia sp.]
MKKIVNFLNKQTWKGVALLGLSILLMIVGVVREEPATVLQKAVHICMECIGIG